MASLEEVMAGLFGTNAAPGAEDELRRRRAGGAAGGAALYNEFLPFISGLGGYDYSGPGRGLVDMLSGITGPAARHLQRMGAQAQDLPPGLAGRDQLPPGLAGRDELPPGLDNRNPLGGPNVAPGNVDTGQALHQPQGRALGQSQVPHTQGWLNVAPGYAIAAGRGFGTDAYGRPQQGPGGDVGAVRPGLRGAQSGGGGAAKGVGGAPSGGGPAGTPASGGGGSRTGINRGPAGGGGGSRPGAGRPAGKSPMPRPGNATARNQNKADRATVRAGTASPGTNVRPNQVAKTNPKGGTQGINKQTGGPQTNAGQAVAFGPGVNGPIVQVADQGGQGGKGVVQSGPPPHRTAPPPPKPSAGRTRPTRDPRQR